MNQYYDLGKGGAQIGKTNNEFEPIIATLLLLLMTNDNNNDNKKISMMIMMRKGKAVIGKVNIEKEAEF